MWISTELKFTHYKSTGEGTSSASFCTSTTVTASVGSIVNRFWRLEAAWIHTPKRSNTVRKAVINVVFFIRLVLHLLQKPDSKRNNARLLWNIIEGGRFLIPAPLSFYLPCRFYRKPDHSFLFLYRRSYYSVSYNKPSLPSYAGQFYVA